MNSANKSTIFKAHNNNPMVNDGSIHNFYWESLINFRQIPNSKSFERFETLFIRFPLIQHFSLRFSYCVSLLPNSIETETRIRQSGRVETGQDVIYS